MGAFGAHALKPMLSVSSLATYETAVQYQMWHSLAMLFCAVLMINKPLVYFRWAALLLLIGVLLFSGSLYLLTFDAPRWLGPVTPLGGVCLILAWVLLLIGTLKLER